MHSDDFIDELGGLVLDHRFKRFSQRLLLEAESLYRDAGVDFKPRWVSTYLLLERQPGLAIGEIAARLHLSHPAVIQIARAMEKAGLVESCGDPEDGRRHLLSLTASGAARGESLRELWDSMARRQLEIFETAGVDILSALDRATTALDESPLAARVLAAAN